MASEVPSTSSGSAPASSAASSTSSASPASATSVPQESVLQRVSKAPISEAEGRQIFNDYGVKDQLGFEELRARLLDLQTVWGFPRVVPDSVVEAALHELQLGVEQSSSVS